MHSNNYVLQTFCIEHCSVYSKMTVCGEELEG